MELPTTWPSSGRIQVRNEYNNAVGHLDFSIRAQAGGGETLHINSLSINTGLRSRGVSDAVLGQVVQNNPRIMSISGELAGENLRIYQQAIGQNLPPIEAVRRTPAYRLRRRLGFGTIDHFEVNAWGTPILRTSRP